MKKIIKIAITILFICVAVYILKISPILSYFPDSQNNIALIKTIEDKILSFGLFAPMIFIFFFILCIIFFLPAIIPISIGCLIFGKWHGLLYNFLGVISGGSLSFIISRYLLRDFTSKFLIRGPLKNFDNKIAKHGFYIILYFCLLLIPFTYLSFATGLSKIKFKHYLSGTALGVIPGLVMLTFFWTAIKQLLLTYKNPSDFMQFDVILPLIFFIISIFIPLVVKRFKKRFFITNKIKNNFTEVD